MSRMAYIAYPIDQANPHSWLNGLIESAEEGLIRERLVDVIFDPGDGFTVRPGAEPGGEIAPINRHAAHRADLVVAFLPKGVATIGVPIEIDTAVRAGKVVGILTDVESWMLQYPQSKRVRTFSLDPAGKNALLAWLANDQPQPVAAPDEAPDPLPVRAWGGGRLPTRGHDDDAGLDLYVSETVIIEPGQAVDVPCSVAVQLPEWGWGLLTGRSSARRVHGLLIHPGVIDAGYRGELFALAENTTDAPIKVEAGSRLAQLIVLPNLTKDLQPTEVEDLDPHQRGTNGFGSTGR